MIALFAAAAVAVTIAGSLLARTADVPESGREHGRRMAKRWLRFSGYAAVLAVAGWAIALTGAEIADRTGLSDTAVGSLLTATSTSLPELFTVITTVRAGALTMAVADIVGGNTFDTLIVGMSDAAYRGGSIYDVFRAPEAFLFSMGVLMTALLLMGLLRRERRGPGGIGFESLAVLGLYALSVWILFTLG